jgi:hypothetical protein
MQKKMLKSQEYQAKDAQFKEKRQQKRGFLASVRDYTSEAMYQMSKGVNKAGSAVTDRWKEWDYDYTANYFREHFPSLRSETVWDSAIYCRTISDGRPFFGVAMASTNYVCFDGYLTKSERLQFAIPLRMISSIQLAFAPPPANPSLAPAIQTATTSQVKADALQVFTNDNKVHYFYSFQSTKSFKDFYNIIDHAWRANLAGQGSVLYIHPAAQPQAAPPISQPGGLVEKPFYSTTTTTTTFSPSAAASSSSTISPARPISPTEMSVSPTTYQPPVSVAPNPYAMGASPHTTASAPNQPTPI